MSVQVIGDHAIGPALHDLIVGAEKWLLLVSPYVKLHRLAHYTRALEEAIDRRVFVQLVVRSRRLESAEERCLRRLARRGVRISEVEGLHAKIYASDREALVTSLNLQDTSINGAIEVAVRLTGRERDEVCSYLRDLEARERPHPVSQRRPLGWFVSETGQENQGHCIRCAVCIPLDRQRPYCRAHFMEWDQRRDRKQREQHCHGCGRSEGTTIRRPLCEVCFRAAT